MLLNLKQIHQSNAPAGDGVSALLLPFLSVRDNSRQGDEVVNGGSEHGKGGGHPRRAAHSGCRSGGEHTQGGLQGQSLLGCVQVYRKSRAPMANSKLLNNRSSRPAFITERVTHQHEKSLTLIVTCKLNIRGLKINGGIEIAD